MFSPHYVSLLLAFVSAVFSSLHAVAWNFDFPTAAEKTIWHACTILTLSLPPLGLIGIPLSQATRRQGNPREFLYASVRVLRELAWHLEGADDKEKVDRARHDLEESYMSSLADPRSGLAKRCYRDILWPAGDGTPTNGLRLRQYLLDFVEKKEPFQHRPDLDLPPRYGIHLRQLLRLVEGHGSKKMVERVARTDVFPRQKLLPPAFSSWFLYVVTVLYSLTRLLLFAVSISSLRAMPEGVYKTTWAEYIPAI